MKAPGRFELTKAELDSALWKKLSAHFEGRLDIARKQNDSELGVKRTNKLRGKIAAYKEVLGLNNPVTLIVDREADNRSDV